MGIGAAITKLDRNFGWSFLGFVLAVIFGALAVYSEFWKKTAPILEFELLSNTPVLDVREKLPDLEVLYQGEDIAKAGRTLSVMLCRVVNHGSANLLSAHYDNKAPIGIAVNGGTLIRAELSATSNPYLATAAAVRAHGSTVAFEPVILEPGEWFLVKLLVLHKAGSPPSLTAHGKIAGMHSIPIVLSVPTSDKESFWYRAFSGSTWTQLVRLVAYFLGAILCVAAVVIPFTAAAEKITTTRRKKFVARFRAVTKIALDPADEFIFSRYIDKGPQYVQRLANAVADSDRLQKRVEDYLAAKDGPQLDLLDLEQLYMNDRLSEESPVRMHRMRLRRDYYETGEMIRNMFIKKVNGRWAAVPDRLKVAAAFIDYIELLDATNV